MAIIDDIKARLTILDVCDMCGIQVNRSTWKAQSFINRDSNPSLHIYVSNNRFKDYSANEQGDQIDLYALFYRLDKKQAVRDLAKLVSTGEARPIHSAPVNHEAEALHRGTDDFLNCLTVDERYYYDERTGMGEEEHRVKDVIRKRRIADNAVVFRELYEYCTGEGWDSAAYRYMTDLRNLSHDILKKFRVFSIRNYNQVNNHLKKKFSAEQLIRCGLMRLKQDGTYNLCFYNHRIIIPYLWAGDIVYLRGRYFDSKGNTSDPQKKCGKYMAVRNDAVGVNSPKRFFNGDVLKGLTARQVLYITEGELDTIAIESMGYNAIAIPGVSNLPSDRLWDGIRNLHVKLVLDNDAPGRELQKIVVEKLQARYNRVFEKGLGNYKDANEWLVAHGR